MKLDSRNFFPSIDHTILKDQLRRVIPCRLTWERACLGIDGSDPQESAGESRRGGGGIST